MNTQKRNALLSWLEDGGAADDVAGCRILSNARCLSEGVDVPALDAVMFLSPRKSQVDIVQSVGRVMRTAPGKKYGYIILPVGVPAGVSPEEVLDKDAKYQVVWDVLQALRAHDDRFNAEINKIDLNKKKGARINIVDGTGRIGKEYGEDEEGDLTVSSGEAVSEYLPGWSLTIGEWREAILATGRNGPGILRRLRKSRRLRFRICWKADTVRRSFNAF
jgi:predicted helicase